MIWFSSVPPKVICLAEFLQFSDCTEKMIKVSERSVISVSVQVIRTSKLINNQLICPLLQNRHTPSLQHHGILKQCSSVPSPFSGAHTHSRKCSHKHTELQLCFEEGRNVQTECIRLRFEHLHEQLSYCIMQPPLAPLCSPFYSTSLLLYITVSLEINSQRPI